MEEKKFTYVIENESGRIDKFLSTKLKEFSRTQIQNWINDGLVIVNKQSVKTNYKIQAGDKIVLEIPEPEEIATDPEDIPIEIIYQDKDVVVVNKPQKMVVHPSAGHHSGTLVNALLYHIKDLSGINEKIRPGIVHRIDKDTSGLLVVAKNDNAHQKLAEQFQKKSVLREYIALVHGVIPHNKGTVDAPIGRDPKDRKKFSVVEDGKEAKTHFEVIERFAEFSLLKVRLETGRTHQIRVHMKYIGFPLAGDPDYGPRKTLKGEGQFLHAMRIGFDHPSTGEELLFDSDLPAIFQKTLAQLRKNK